MSITFSRKNNCAHNLIFNQNTTRPNKCDGFTLVELIVVVVVIGILSSIAIPSFTNYADKVKQKEATVAINAYLKAAQAYSAEYSALPQNSSDISQFVNIQACCYGCSGRQDPTYCRRNPSISLDNVKARSWNLTSGLYAIGIYPSSTQVQFTANPTAWFQGRGYGVSGCFSMTSGTMKLFESKNRNHLTPPPSCQ